MINGYLFSLYNKSSFKNFVFIVKVHNEIKGQLLKGP